MQIVSVKNLDKYHPGYHDRSLIWCKFYFSMMNGEPEFEMLCEIDQWRYCKFVMLQLQTKKPVPVDLNYLARKGFDNKKRPISLTLQMLHSFLEVRDETVTQSRVYKEEYIKKSRVYKQEKEKKFLHLEFVLLTEKEFKSLKEKMGAVERDRYIGNLNGYIGSKGDKYKSHYHTIIMWHTRDGGKNTQSVTKRLGLE